MNPPNGWSAGASRSRLPRICVARLMLDDGWTSAPDLCALGCNARPLWVFRHQGTPGREILSIPRSTDFIGRPTLRGLVNAADCSGRWSLGCRWREFFLWVFQLRQSPGAVRGPFSQGRLARGLSLRYDLATIRTSMIHKPHRRLGAVGASGLKPSLFHD